MISNFLNSGSLHEIFQVSLSFRFTREYRDGLLLRVASNAALYPIKLPIFRIYRRGVSSSRSPVVKLLDYIFYLIEYIPVTIANLILLIRLFHRIKPDILHINNGGYPGALSCRMAVIAARVTGVRNIVFVVNNIAVDYKHPYRWLDILVDRLVVRYTSFFVTGSYVAISHLKSILKIPDARAINLPNGVGLREISETRKETLSRLGFADFGGTIFGVISAMEPRKGHLHLFQSIKSLIESNQNTKNFIILVEGSGGICDSLTRFVEDNDLSQVIRFIGSENQVFNFISAIDVLIFPSTHGEDFPNVISEAMALSKPVIATRVGGTTEQLLDNHTGFLVEVDSVTELSGAILKLIQEPSRIEVMGKRGQERYFERFTVEKSIENYVQLYTNLLNLSKK
jgi:glycosyltransferase involved in cell wall biosynthesis